MGLHNNDGPDAYFCRYPAHLDYASGNIRHVFFKQASQLSNRIRILIHERQE
jgi:hypothetical protein